MEGGLQWAAVSASTFHIMFRWMLASTASRTSLNPLRCHAATLSTVPNTVGGLERVCIVGTGPAGFYCAKYILKDHPTARVDMIDMLPTPFGQCIPDSFLFRCVNSVMRCRRLVAGEQCHPCF